MPFRPLTPKEKQEYGKLRPCLSPEHSPPSMQVLPPGLHVWVCPACGHETMLQIPAVIYGGPSTTDVPLEPVTTPDIKSLDELRRQLEVWRDGQKPQPQFPPPHWPPNTIPMHSGSIDFGSHPAGVTSSMLASFVPVPEDRVSHFAE